MWVTHRQCEGKAERERENEHFHSEIKSFLTSSHTLRVPSPASAPAPPLLTHSVSLSLSLEGFFIYFFLASTFVCYSLCRRVPPCVCASVDILCEYSENDKNKSLSLSLTCCVLQLEERETNRQYSHRRNHVVVLPLVIHFSSFSLSISSKGNPEQRKQARPVYAVCIEIFFWF